MEFSLLVGEKRQRPINSNPADKFLQKYILASLGKVGFNFPTCLLLETPLHAVHITSNSTPLFEKQHLMLCCKRSVNLFATKEPQFMILLEI